MAVDAHNESVKSQHGALEGLKSKPVFADLHPLMRGRGRGRSRSRSRSGSRSTSREYEYDPDPHLSEKPDPGPHYSDRLNKK